MAWAIELSPGASRALEQLDPQHERRILNFLQRLADLDNPRSIGEPLRGELRQHWRYRIGDYRVICTIKEEQLVVLVVKIGHRREVYRH